MTLQTTSTPGTSQGRGRRSILVSVLAIASLGVMACGGGERAAEGATVRASVAAPSAAHVAGFETQPLSADPCAWVAPADVARLLGRTIRGVPVRVSSAESLTPSAGGSGCMYELEPKVGETSGMVSLEVKIDGVEMESGLGAASMGMFASADGKWTRQWDWVSGLPAGLFAAREGYAGILVAINDVSLSPKDVEPLAAAVMAKLPDVPFANAPADPTVAGGDPDPCSLVTRAEAESVLGTLRFAPYRSRELTPVAHGDGASCTYYTAGHHVVVLTPNWSDGKTLYGMMGGIGGLTSLVTGERATTSVAGPWDETTTGVAGTRYFLKGDRMLQLQHRGSKLDDVGAVKFARIAVGRL